MPVSSLRLRHFAPRRTGDASPLGDLENAVMDVVWGSCDKVSVSQVHTTLLAKQPSTGMVAYTTVKTTMERLADKGILTRVRDGKAYGYGAALSREELERRIVTQVLSNLVRDFPSAVASFFAHPTPDLSEEKLTLLTEAIEKAKKGEKEESDA